MITMIADHLGDDEFMIGIQMNRSDWSLLRKKVQRIKRENWETVKANYYVLSQFQDTFLKPRSKLLFSPAFAGCACIQQEHQLKPACTTCSGSTQQRYKSRLFLILSLLPTLSGDFMEIFGLSFNVPPIPPRNNSAFVQYKQSNGIR